MTSTVLGPHVQLFPPTLSGLGQELPAGGQQPSIVLLIGWFSASMSSLLKYVEMHRTLFPAAEILLVDTPAPMFSLSDSERERERYLGPVIEVLINRMYSPDNQRGGSSGLLVHLFSNAGGLQLKTISRLLNQRIKLHQEALLPKNTFAFVIDSSPGSEEYKALLNALSALIKSNIGKASAQIPLWMIVYGYYLVNIKILRNNLILPPMREFLEQSRLLPGSGMGSPRLYVYSDADDVVLSSSVEQHLSNISAKSIPFHVKRFKGSAHVSHMPQEPSRYRRAIVNLWVQASNDVQGGMGHAELEYAKL